jgi:hypothetical protein
MPKPQAFERLRSIARAGAVLQLQGLSPTRQQQARTNLQQEQQHLPEEQPQMQPFQIQPRPQPRP